MNPIIELDVTSDVLTRLESQQTPLRIQGHRQSYYILTIEQIVALMQPPQNFEDDTTFTPDDFGLSEADIANYLARQQERQQYLGNPQHIPLPFELRERLDMLRSLSAVSASALPVDEQTIRALEAAMLRNIEATIQHMQHQP